MFKSLNVVERFQFAVLLALSEGEGSNKHIITLCEKLIITDGKFNEPLDSGDTYGRKNIRWAIQNLHNRQAILRLRKGWYEITELGKQELEDLVRQVHARFSEYGDKQGFTDIAINRICSLANDIHNRDVQEILAQP
jgi:hypothetical protein